MGQTIILCYGMRDASEYAKLAGLPAHSWRWIPSAETCNGIWPSAIVQLPSYAKRGNRFAIDARLKQVERAYRIERQVVTQEDLDALRTPEEDLAASPTDDEDAARPHVKHPIGEQFAFDDNFFDV